MDGPRHAGGWFAQLRRSVAHRTGRRTVDEQLVPQIVNEKTVQEPGWSLAHALQHFRIDKFIRGDALNERPQRSPGSQPLEDRLPETELLSIRQLGRGQPRQSPFEQILGPAKAETHLRRKIE